MVNSVALLPSASHNTITMEVAKEKVGRVSVVLIESRVDIG